MRQLIVGLVAEGSTDVRFLKRVVQNSIQDISWGCSCQVEISEIKAIKSAGSSFIERMLNASRLACNSGVSILCVHADSDNRSIQTVLEHKFSPFFKELEERDEKEYCKIVIPTIPIQMIESWMMADKELFKQLINASGKRDVDLGIEKAPESYSDPKSVLENAIRISMEQQPRKRRDQIKLSELYDLLGSRVSLDKLRMIPSFNHFETQVMASFKSIGLMR